MADASTYVDRALAGEYGPLEESNEAALRAAYAKESDAALFNHDRPLAFPPELLGLTDWEWSALRHDADHLLPVLLAHRERRDLEAQLAALRSVVARLAAGPEGDGGEWLFIDYNGGTDTPTCSLCYTPAPELGPSKLGGFDHGEIVHSTDCLWLAARAMGVEVEP